MGRRRKTEAELRTERFKKIYGAGKGGCGLTEEQIGSMINLKRPALLARRKDPGKFSLNQLITLGNAFGWTEDDYLAIIFPERR